MPLTETALPVIIRKMTPSDADAVMDMMRTFYASPAVLTNGTDAIFSADISECTSDSPYAEGYVFEHEGDLQGYAMLAKSYSTEFGKRCIWLEDLYIKETMRGRGLGLRFFEFLFATYHDVIFRLEAEEENEGAVALYRKVGFEILPYLEMIKKQTN